jgi:hypothetical protein
MAGDITAGDITAGDIAARDITAEDITAEDITAGDITAGDTVTVGTGTVVAGGQATEWVRAGKCPPQDGFGSATKYEQGGWLRQLPSPIRIDLGS